MTFQSTNDLYGFPQPLTRVFPAPIIAQRAPATSDYKYQIGQVWVDEVGKDAYILASVASNVATWNIMASDSGGVLTLTGGSGGAISPTGGGTINVLGTANQITTTGSGNTITWSLPSAITAPGSLTTTTTLAAGTSFSAGTTVTAGTGIVATTGNISATAGAVNAGTSMTATAGNITATLGNVVINGAAKQLQVHGGAVTDFVGTATLTSGTVTIANTNIAATDRVFVNRSAVNASSALGVFKVVKTAATNFIITACKPADATTETGDASTVEYFIVRQV